MMHLLKLVKVNRIVESKQCLFIFSRCDHNQYSIDYILALSKAKRKFQPESSEDIDQSEDAGHSEDTDQSGSDSEQSDTLRTEYQSEPLSDSESHSSYSMDYT